MLFSLKRCLFLFLCITLSSLSVAERPKIGLCITATGRYDTFATTLIASARQFFLTDCDVTYFVFTDGCIERASDVQVIYQKRLGWPLDTLMRFEVYLKNQHLFEKYDYIFASDADMLFVSSVGKEILADLVGTIHPGYYNKPGTYETRKYSTAYVHPRKAKHYFAGGFYGGKKEEFIKLISTTSTNIQKDLAHDFIAVWHDESHLNRYFFDHPPTLKLDPSYCYPESWNIPFTKRLLALDKNHSEIRK